MGNKTLYDRSEKWNKVSYWINTENEFPRIFFFNVFVYENMGHLKGKTFCHVPGKTGLKWEQNLSVVYKYVYCMAFKNSLALCIL